MSGIKRICIVDDDIMFRQMLVDYIFEKGNYEIATYNTGEDCLRALRTDVPDVIILDYFLNAVNKDAVNGMVILNKIRKDYPSVHVIMLSGQEKYGVAASIIAKGAEQYIMKDKEAFGKIGAFLESNN